MGILFSRVFQALFGSKEVRILILGLDNAGKTTILYKLQNETDDEEIMTIPTIGFNVETLQYKNIKFQVWDLGGQTSIRPYDAVPKKADFKPLQLGQIEVDSADFWTNRLLSASSLR